MRRRKYLAALGSLAAGGAATMGTGAVSSVTADRDVDLYIASDSNAYLGLKSNSPYVRTASQTDAIFFDFSQNNPNVVGDGLNNRADTVINDAFTIQNRTNNGFYLWAGFTTPSGGSIDPTSGGARSVELVGDGADNDVQGTDITFPGSASKSNFPATSRVLSQTTETGTIFLPSGNSAGFDIRFLVYGSLPSRTSDFRVVFKAATDSPGQTTKGDHMFTANGDPS